MQPGIYAGIGSRETPAEVCKVMIDYAAHLARKGWLLRSGGAKGADTAFETGCDLEGGKKEIFYAKDCTKDARLLLQRHYPNIRGKSDYVMKLLARNLMIIYGADLATPVNAIICWTPNGLDVGGTAIGLNEARSSGIKITNLGKPDTLKRVIDLLEGIK